MKTLKYLFVLIAASLMTVSCYNLDILPKSTVTQDILFGTDDGIKKYFAITYHDLPIEDFNMYVNSRYLVYGYSNNAWEGTKNSPSGPAGESANRQMSYSGFDYWTFRASQGHGPYNRIREINNFIAGIGDYQEGAKLQEYLAEARFLRAFYYSALVRYHGGVVIMDEALNPLADPLELQKERNTEYDCYKFIYEDLKFAMENGSTTKTAGRANRYVAAAFMSRIMLTAATIAKYSSATGVTGDATRAGLMNMSSQYADEFFQYAIDAAKMVVNEGGYKLHSGSDKEAAFVEQFQKATDDEDIFIKQYGYNTQGVTGDHYLNHFWDLAVLPRGVGLAQDLGCMIDPSYNLLQLFEMPAIVDENGYPVRFNSVEELWNTDKMEPRARATFFFPGMTDPASGVKFDMQGGVYKTFKWPDGRPGYASDATSVNSNRSQNDFTGSSNNGIRVIVNDGQNVHVNANNAGQYGNLPVGTKINGVHGSQSSGDENWSETGFLIRKYVSDKANERSWARCIQPWKAIRYGEVLLNLAEALYELGLSKGDAAMKAEAFTYIAQIRDRAGATPYTMKASPIDVGALSIEQGGKGYTGISIDENLQFIRDERGRELAFENRRIYDLIRWRVADQEFTNNRGRIRALMPYYIMDEGKWIFLAEMNAQNRNASFSKQRYYRQIPGGAIERNPKLLINDGY